MHVQSCPQDREVATGCLCHSSSRFGPGHFIQRVLSCHHALSSYQFAEVRILGNALVGFDSPDPPDGTFGDVEVYGTGDA